MASFSELMAAGCLGYMAGIISVIAFFGWAFLPSPEDDDDELCGLRKGSREPENGPL